MHIQRPGLLGLLAALLSHLMICLTGPVGVPGAAAATYRSVANLHSAVGGQMSGTHAERDVAHTLGGNKVGRRLMDVCHTKKCIEAIPVCPRCTSATDSDTGHCRHTGRVFQCHRMPLYHSTPDEDDPFKADSDDDR